MKPDLFISSIKKKYFNLSEVSKIVEESPQLLRSWEKELNLDIPEKNPNKKTRKYQQKHIDTFLKIKKLLRVNKYTLKGIKPIIKGKKNQPSLQNIIRDMEKMRSDLIKMRDSLKYPPDEPHEA